MTTLYRPVLIESAEQAEALPVGTLAKRPQHYSIEKVDECPDEWTDTCNAEPRTSSNVVGWTALVPIEAEEETRVTPEALVAAAGQVLARVEETARTYALPPTPLTIQQQARLVTPWESA